MVQTRMHWYTLVAKLRVALSRQQTENVNLLRRELIDGCNFTTENCLHTKDLPARNG